MSEQAGWRFGVRGEHAFFLFFLEKWLQLCAHRLGARRGRSQKALITIVRSHIFDAETYVLDRVAPVTGIEIAPSVLFNLSCELRRGRHDTILLVKHSRWTRNSPTLWRDGAKA